MIACHTPTKGPAGVTNVPRWKFDLIRGHILAILAEGPLAFADLPGVVRDRLVPEDLERLGSVNWHVTTIKLEMEVRGEIERLRQAGRQVLRVVDS